MIGLPVPICVPPQDPVYQRITVPDTEADKLDELPLQIAVGDAAGVGLAGGVKVPVEVVTHVVSVDDEQHCQGGQEHE